MRNNNEAKTIERNYLQRFRFLIREYELIKAQRPVRFNFCEDLSKAHNTAL